MPRAKGTVIKSHKGQSPCDKGTGTLNSVEATDADTSNSTIAYVDSDESMSEMITVEAEVLSEAASEQTYKYNDEGQPDIYCVPSCRYNRKEGGAAMSKCCLCMDWFHPVCLGDTEEDAESFWTCMRCRRIPYKVYDLAEIINSKFNAIIGKINDIHHVNTKLLGDIEKCKRENKLLRLKLEEKLEKMPVRCQSCVTYEADKTKSTKSTTVQKIPSSQKDNTCANINIVPRSLNIICDSIPKRLDESNMTEAIGAQTNIRSEANSVNEAVDFVQDKANASSMNIFHTGKESVKIITHRFQRLEANINHKKLEHVGISSIIHRRGTIYKEQTMAVNKVLRQMCIRNQWLYIDNDNIDEQCLWKDGFHLNQKGKQQFIQNVASTVSPFMKTLSLMKPK